MTNAIEQIEALANRRLSEAEWSAYVDAPVSEREREEISSLIRWFRRRYPTPLQRLRSARRAHKQAALRIAIAVR